MRRRVAVALMLIVTIQLAPSAAADTIGSDGESHGGAETTGEGVRVTILVSGGQHVVQAVSGAGSGVQSGCAWSLVFAPDLDDTPYGTSAGPKPHPDARFALLLCNGSNVRAIWVSPDDIVDLDALARDEAQRYIEDVLVPVVGIGVNPAGRGLVGLPSWFWVEGFTGSVSAPPISAFGVTIDVRMSSGSIAWDFGDGSRVLGDLGQAYPAESSVQHIHQSDGEFTVTATIDLVPEYRVDGGPWLALPNLQATASTQLPVEERQAVVTDT